MSARLAAALLYVAVSMGCGRDEVPVPVPEAGKSELQAAARRGDDSVRLAREEAARAMEEAVRARDAARSAQEATARVVAQEAARKASLDGDRAARAEAARRAQEAEREAERKADEERRAAFQERLHKGMILIPAGTFRMGCNDELDPGCGDEEKPVHEVELDAYWIDATEVTVAQFKECVDSGSCDKPSPAPPPSWGDDDRPEDWRWACTWGRDGMDSHPVNCVSWTQARMYCRYRFKRLPTEAEWERAARGTDGRRYPWGNEAPGSGGKVANLADDSAARPRPGLEVTKGYDDGFRGTAPVGSFPDGASPYGVLDMAGNESEWVNDYYEFDYYAKSPPKNPQGPSWTRTHVIRGGGWLDRAGDVRVSARTFRESDQTYMAPGFRCAVDAAAH